MRVKRKKEKIKRRSLF